MTTVKKAQFRIVAKTRRNQDGVKENSKRSNAVKSSARIIKRGVLYNNILYSVENLISATKNTEESTNSILQAILLLFYDTLKKDLIHMGGKISDFPNIKEWTMALNIYRRQGRDIIKDKAIKIAYLRGVARMYQ